ncbi:thiosulfate:glutathione sulfurtransferase-like isoform X1 [Simochromis diagramma]|uniref:thiosulfate:glutathione sulfurtransferase-like isoform X1 n=1 Tax=Simochromis diagramma TaxID=43689 RepID=UPI001A7ED612|nr:thiosulfate:glutathione sulfurtransferase-like isoform X1 [Simochromis diagramma]
MHSCVRMICHLKPVSKKESGVVLLNLMKRFFCRVQGTKDISYEELKALVGKSPNLILIDVRSEEEVAKGHIPGCTNIPLDTVETAFAMNPEEFKAKYGIKKPQLDAPELVFSCQTGRRSGLAIGKVQQLGYVTACNYTGGYSEWSKKEGK